MRVPGQDPNNPGLPPAGEPQGGQEQQPGTGTQTPPAGEPQGGQGETGGQFGPFGNDANKVFEAYQEIQRYKTALEGERNELKDRLEELEDKMEQGRQAPPTPADSQAFFDKLSKDHKAAIMEVIQPSMDDMRATVTKSNVLRMIRDMRVSYPDFVTYEPRIKEMLADRNRVVNPLHPDALMTCYTLAKAEKGQAVGNGNTAPLRTPPFVESGARAADPGARGNVDLDSLSFDELEKLAIQESDRLRKEGLA